MYYKLPSLHGTTPGPVICIKPGELSKALVGDPGITLYLLMETLRLDKWAMVSVIRNMGAKHLLILLWGHRAHLANNSVDFHL